MTKLASESEMSRQITFEEGWPVMQEGINKVIDSLEGGSRIHVPAEEYIHIYTTGYNIRWSKSFSDAGFHKLYDKCKKSFEDYISSRVLLPSLREKRDYSFLQELVKRWNDHKTMTRWLSKYFAYLEISIRAKGLPRLKESSHLIFYELVYGEMNDRVKDFVTSLVVDHELLLVHAKKLEEKELESEELQSEAL